ncbi:ammonium transporter [Caulobacter soli]|uniref:ammonium transporter n=1 Tax=Caulobacter soli TaxID=2708539 RepID=UPI00196A9B9E|nr:ammonium transporter [Caulobacter soli]
MNREWVGSLVWAGAILAVTLSAVVARKLGYVDGDTVTRLVIGMNGLMIAWQGNRMPKVFVPNAQAPNAQARKARRVAGWSLALSGLVYAGLFAFAPIRQAALGGTGAVLAGIVVTLGYCLSLRDTTKAA